MKKNKLRAEIICDLIQAFDPYGMSDLTPELCDDDISTILTQLYDYYIGCGLIEQDDPEFAELCDIIKFYGVV